MNVKLFSLIGVLISLTIQLTAQEFVVQVAAFSDPVESYYFTDKGLNGVFGETDHNLINRYFMGPYDTEDLAKRAVLKARNAGFEYARVVNLRVLKEQCEAGCAPLDNYPITNLFPDDDLFIRNIFFDFDRSALKPESISQLEKLYDIMQQNPNLRVELHGHTDWIGSHEYNLALSKRRGYKVRNYLLNMGIPRSRLVVKGFGENSPIAKNRYADGRDCEEGRQLNRRVELRIIDETGQILWNKVESINVPSDLKVE